MINDFLFSQTQQKEEIETFKINELYVQSNFFDHIVIAENCPRTREVWSGYQKPKSSNLMCATHEKFKIGVIDY